MLSKSGIICIPSKVGTVKQNDYSRAAAKLKTAGIKYRTAVDSIQSSSHSQGSFGLAAASYEIFVHKDDEGLALKAIHSKPFG
ncbi:hypothetical protein [Bacillus marinisedimentorum]|uniref:hypothetical protein n=1 Tax=Bacillus marinisedimentorum TaxID=1821260 RepID=UPI000872691D|nr:hypothetical protein [Bacillus marinisedimentorum]